MHRILAGEVKLPPSSSHVFLTKKLPRPDQSDAQRPVGSGIIDPDPVDDAADDTEVETCPWYVGDLVLARTRLPKIFARAWHHRTRSDLDHWCIVLAKEADGSSGSTASETGTRSSAKPFPGFGADTEFTCLYVPRDRLPATVNALNGEGAAVLSAWVAGILAVHIENLVREIDLVPQTGWPVLADSTCALLAACLVQTQECVVAAPPSVHAALRKRARRIVAANLSATEFGPSEMARLLFVSRSKLYRIFEADGGVARFIQRERLTHANHILAQATSRISISTLSQTVGFRDHAAFSRAYKNEFGSCPREARDAMLADRLAGDPGGPDLGVAAARTVATKPRPTGAAPVPEPS